MGDSLEIKVTNNIGDQLSLIHWHGLTQVNNSWMDGPPLNQCPINTRKNGVLFSPINSVTSMVYKLKPQAPGTYWYHGHLGPQPIDGLAGTLVVEDTQTILSNYRASGVTYVADIIYVLTDFYNRPAPSYMAWYLSPASGGDEPMPDQFAVNGLFSGTLVEKVNKADKLRVRIVCASAFSMFNISVDGMPLTVIEIDANPTMPFDVSYIVINSGQRVSFVLDWTKLNPSISTSPSVLLRVNAIPKMYPTFDENEPNFGLKGTDSGKNLNLHWTGRFLFNELQTVNGGNPNYDTTKAPPSSPAKPPSDTNLIQALPLSSPTFTPPTVPPPDLNVKFLIEFYDDEFGVNRPHVNGARFPDFTDQTLSSPTLFQHMRAQGGPYTYLDNPSKPLPVGSWIPGNGTYPFVLPYKRTIDVWINNTDGGEHPMHLHGHDFWIIESSDYPGTITQPILRDTISVPAQGSARIRFVSDNPGVWFFHCHIDWHLEAGLAAYFIEAPSKLKGTINFLPKDLKAECPSFFTPTGSPTLKPSKKPSVKPSYKPSVRVPSVSPTYKPSGKPTYKPSFKPTFRPQ